MEIIDYILITYYSLGGIILLLFYVLLKKNARRNISYKV